MTNINLDSPQSRPHLALPGPASKNIIVAGGFILAFAAISALTIQLSDQASWIMFIPLIVIAIGIGLWVVIRAIRGSTPAIIAYLVLVIFITDAQFRARGAGEIGTDWQSAMKFGLWLGAGAIGFAHAPPIRTWFNRLGPACWLIYTTIAMISSIYAPAPAYSFGTAFSLFCFLAFAFALITKLSEGQFLWALTGTLAVFIAIGWVVYYVNPTLGTSEFWTYGGIEYRMCGIAGQANNLGSICAKYLGGIFLLWASGRCKLRYAIPLAALGVASLSASDARTGMIAAVVAIVAVVLARSLKGLAAASLAAVMGTLLVLVFSLRLDALGSHFSRSGDPTEIYTLTGRLQIWDFVWQEIQERPFFGWGYSASKVLLPAHIGFQDGLMIDTAHNMLLQSLLSVGFIGTLPVLVISVYLLFSMIYRPYAFRDLFFLVVVISGISDTSALATTPTNLSLLLLMASVMPRAPARRLTLPRALISNLPPGKRALVSRGALA